MEMQKRRKVREKVKQRDGGLRRNKHGRVII